MSYWGRLLPNIFSLRHQSEAIHIKAFLSAVFKHAKQEGVLDGLNPMVDVSVPGRPTKFRGAAYTMSEVARMLEDLEPNEQLTDAGVRWYHTAGEVIGVLALTGLRQSECRGLRWVGLGRRQSGVESQPLRVGDARRANEDCSRRELNPRYSVVEEYF
jgi:integrase